MQIQSMHFKARAGEKLADQRLQQNLKKPCKVLFAKERRSFRQRRALIRSRRNQIRIRPANFRNQQIPHVSNRFTAKVLQVAEPKRLNVLLRTPPAEHV